MLVKDWRRVQTHLPLLASPMQRVSHVDALARVRDASRDLTWVGGPKREVELAHIIFGANLR